MKSALQKSPIPETHAFVAKRLREPIFDPTWHFHSEYQLFLVIQGQGTRYIGDSVTYYKPGNITFIGPELPHFYRNETETIPENEEDYSEGIVIYFSENLIGKNLLWTEEAILIDQLLKKSLRGLDVKGDTKDKVGKMFINLLQLTEFDAILELLNMLNTLSKTDDLEFLASPGYTNTLKEGDTERMNKVYAYIMKNFRQNLAITELAELVNMTPTSFSRYFKVHANKTFSQFVSEIRIGHACKLLIDKKMNVTQACYASGFNTLSNFNKQFKAITKRTPLAYKKKYKIS